MKYLTFISLWIWRWRLLGHHLSCCPAGVHQELSKRPKALKAEDKTRLYTNFGLEFTYSMAFKSHLSQPQFRSHSCRSRADSQTPHVWSGQWKTNAALILAAAVHPLPAGGRCSPANMWCGADMFRCLWESLNSLIPVKMSHVVYSLCFIWNLVLHQLTKTNPMFD